MSWQAQSAVTHHSKQKSIKRFRLLLLLAERADALGTVDPAPRQDTLAGWLGCTDRSIRTQLKALIASGELIQLRTGSGPGNPSAYQIDLPMPENGANSQPAKAEILDRKAEAIMGDASAFAILKAEVLADLKAEVLALKAEVLALKAEVFDPKGGKVEGQRRKGFQRSGADDPYMIHIDPKGSYIYEHPAPEFVAELTAAIAAVVKTPYGPGVNQDQFEAAAYTLIGWGVEQTADLADFPAWWDTNGFYKGKPALKSFLGEFQNYRNGTSLAAPSAGSAGERLRAEIAKAAQGGHDGG